MLQYKIIPVTPFQQNCSIVWCDETMKAVIIDPGGDLPVLESACQALGVTLEQIWITHAHVDHAGGAAELAAKWQLPIIGPHKGDQFWIDCLEMTAVRYRFPPARIFTPTRWLEDGDTVKLGDYVFQVRHCPGHTPGHVVFYSPQMKRAFVGDVLFAGSIGRTDFPRGNHEDLIQSIKQRLWPMGDETFFVPGHGPMSTFGRERRFNPYLAEA